MSQEAKMKLNEFPAGWDEQRVQEVVEYYETQSDEEAAGEHEAALSSSTGTVMEVPSELVPRWTRLVAEIADGSMSLGERAAQLERDRREFREHFQFKHDEVE